ncbi:MAG: sortase [Caldilineae bacterium]|nr:MAG: sortase [Caldilineae bacterium]
MRLVIPALHLETAIIPAPVEGESWRVSHLGQAVGLLEGTAAPGEGGNVVLAGHVTLSPDGRAGPFFRLGALSPGDTAIVYRGDRRYLYRVDSLFTAKPTAIEVTYPSEEPRLTLITCLHYDRAAGRYTDRLVVVAHQVAE